MRLAVGSVRRSGARPRTTPRRRGTSSRARRPGTRTARRPRRGARRSRRATRAGRPRRRASRRPGRRPGRWRRRSRGRSAAAPRAPGRVLLADGLDHVLLDHLDGRPDHLHGLAQRDRPGQLARRRAEHVRGDGRRGVRVPEPLGEGGDAGLGDQPDPGTVLRWQPPVPRHVSSMRVTVAVVRRAHRRLQPPRDRARGPTRLLHVIPRPYFSGRDESRESPNLSELGDAGLLHPWIRRTRVHRGSDGRRTLGMVTSRAHPR